MLSLHSTIRSPLRVPRTCTSNRSSGSSSTSTSSADRAADPVPPDLVRPVGVVVHGVEEPRRVRAPGAAVVAAGHHVVEVVEVGAGAQVAEPQLVDLVAVAGRPTRRAATRPGSRSSPRARSSPSRRPSALTSSTVCVGTATDGSAHDVGVLLPLGGAGRSRRSDARRHGGEESARRHPGDHLGPQRLDLRPQVRHRGVVEGSLGGEVARPAGRRRTPSTGRDRDAGRRARRARREIAARAAGWRSRSQRTRGGTGRECRFRSDMRRKPWFLFRFGCKTADFTDQIGPDTPGIGPVVVDSLQRQAPPPRRGVQMRTRPVRPTRLLAAGALLLAGLAPGLALAPASPAQAADEDVTFTVAVLTDTDSFNPFVGIKATSFEMWALTYDYLIGYSMKDMSPQPGLATSWDTSDDGLTWTFHIRDDVTWSDGEPLTADDIAYTYSRIIDGGPGGRHLGCLPHRREERHRARPADRRADAEEAARDAAAAADPDRARARLEGRQREGGQDLQGRAGERRAGGRLRTVPAGRRARRAARRTSSTPTPTTGAARRTSTTSCSGSTSPRTRWSRR